MDPATAALLIEFVVIPVLRNLAERRGIHGVTEYNIETFVKDPKKALTILRESTSIREKVVDDIADAIENVAAPAIDALAEIFKKATPGGDPDGDTRNR